MNEDQTLLSFGDHVRKLRCNVGLSQEELASLSDLDRTYISGIERGKRNLSLINIVKLASSLNVSLPEIMSFNVEE
ncbi:transcriptional regulator [Oleiphilus sp. HI0061]|uniref:helix-turn-helix domain-containing protein n=1 Tax=Oleiphilus sp. HI0061 TaxID=1822239 RepID=UPI0007CF6D7B|nr:helix-turn-helix transcriptional regulator [Oleiphilus sp. HI0061]KZY62511.1 transcriptional regulator [Oleiphilus sp. HI0061]KZY62522.1 transcriptional regulator [Oleiphilus sp. HI0061]